MILERDTIVAIATAPGKGGVGIVRLSGEQSLTIAKQLHSVKAFNHALLIMPTFIKLVIASSY